MEQLEFNDLRLLLVGIPVLSFLMPIMLGITDMEGHGAYFPTQTLHSFFFVMIYWSLYRGLTIVMRKRYPSFEDTMKRLTLTVIVVLLTTPLLKVLLSGSLEYVLSLFNFPGHPMPNTVQIFVRIYIPSFLIISIYEGVYFFMRYKRSLVEKEQIEIAHVQTQLDNLRNQINPHFLFNGLNTLMNLIPLDPDKAMSYLSKLSKFYRYSVGAQEEKLIPLDKEIEFAHLYSDLLLTRFGDNLSINIDLPAKTYYEILPMSLQLLIENAVKHNIVSKAQPLNIDICLEQSKHVLVVKNKLQKRLDAVSSTGIGLDNIERRFAFFTDTPVQITSTDTEFIVALPLIIRNRKS